MLSVFIYFRSYLSSNGCDLVDCRSLASRMTVVNNNNQKQRSAVFQTLLHARVLCCGTAEQGGCEVIGVCDVPMAPFFDRSNIHRDPLWSMAGQQKHRVFEGVCVCVCVLRVGRDVCVCVCAAFGQMLMVQFFGTLILPPGVMSIMPLRNQNRPICDITRSGAHPDVSCGHHHL